MKYIIFKTNDNIIIDNIIIDIDVEQYAIDKSNAPEYIELTPGVKYLIFNSLAELESNTFYIERKSKDIKEILIKQLNALRVNDQHLPFVYNGKTYLNTEKAKSAIVGKSQVWVQGVTSKEYLTASGEVVNLTKDDFYNIISQIETEETNLYKKESVIKSDIEAITDYNILKAYDVEAEWNK